MFQTSWQNKPQSTTKQLSKIQPYLQQIKNDYSTRLTQSLWQILTFYFGSIDTNGILYTFGNQFINYQPLQWSLQLQKLLQHIIPNSLTFNQLIKRNRDINSQIIIPISYLPQYIDINSYDKLRLNNIKIDHKGLSLQPLDAFYIMLVYNIYHMESIVTSTSQYQHLFLDQFYSSLSRNPLLILLRKNLEYFRNRDKQIFNKIMYILRLYLIDQVVIKYQQDKNKNIVNQENNRSFNMNNSYNNNYNFNINRPQAQDSFYASSTHKKSFQLKYRMKVHHFHTLYLIIGYGMDTIGSDFIKYFQAIIQYFPILKPDQFCLQAFIRIWIFAMSNKNQSNIQNQLINVLQQKANYRQGWFFLKRYSPTSIHTKTSLSSSNIQIVINIIKLLQKQSLWIINSSYLFTITCLFKFLNSSKIYYSQYATSKNGLVLDAKQNVVIQKIMRNIIMKYNQSYMDILSKIKKKNPQEYKQAINLIQIYQQIIEQYYIQYFKSKNILNSMKKSPQRVSLNQSSQMQSQSQSIPIPTSLSKQQNIQNYLPNQFRFKKINEKDIALSLQRNNLVTYDAIGNKLTAENKRGLVAFYRNQPKGCWEIPVQYNQSVILYYVWYTFAKIIDFLIPGRRQYPIVNLRFLANPITFFVVFVVLFILFYFLKEF